MEVMGRMKSEMRSSFVFCDSVKHFAVVCCKWFAKIYILYVWSYFVFVLR